MEKQFQYYAFISYKREDEKWAKWLQGKLESYRLPAVIRKANNDQPKRLHPIFRDKTDLKTGVLKEELRNELEKSRFLIVICSPRSAKSEWVGKEIQSFVEMGRSKNIIPLIIEGTPYSNDINTECLHTVMKEMLPELLGVNINEAGRESKHIKRERAFIRVISKMLDVSFDFLWRRQRRRMIRNAILYSVAAIFFILSLVFVWRTNQPFNVEVKLNETTTHNDNLPFENGRIGLIYDVDTLFSKTINSYDDLLVFNDIPGKYLGKNCKIWFEMWGFEQKASDVLIEKELLLPIKRDSTYGVFQGRVTDGTFDNGDFKGINDVLIQIAEIELNTTTDVNGFFQLEIPINLQRQSYCISISKNGYTSKQYNNVPIISSIKWDMVINPKN